MEPDGESRAAPSRPAGPGGWLSGPRARDGAALFPAGVALAIIILWSFHDGGFDADTWYWGALVLLAVLAATVAGAFGPTAWLRRPQRIALGAFAAYVVWSYASILWAGYAGAALAGSNRALLYLILFALLALVRWTPGRALWLLSGWAIGVGIAGLLVLAAMAQGHNISGLFVEGRLLSPTGYLNADAAMFMMLALVGTALSVRRELPVVVRGVLLALACAGLELAFLAESRGWLFTMPVVVVVGLLALRDRLATAVAAIAPAAGLLACLHALLRVYNTSVHDGGTAPPAAVRAAEHAGRFALAAIFVVLVVGIAAALLGPKLVPRRPGPRSRRLIGTVAAVLGVAIALAGFDVATHGRPFHFISHQWHGFTHPGSSSVGSGSHFASVGGERYDAWRVAWKAFLTHPIGGLGQDNFSEYYDLHRRTGTEFEWTHSLEMRLLAHTGIVGTLAFVVFLVAALAAAIGNRRRGDPLLAAVAGIALLPVIDWLIHGSLDWFWEMPALSGPALGFLAMAGSLTAGLEPVPARARGGRSTLAVLGARLAGGVGLLIAVLVLAFPYLSQRELSIGSDLRATNPGAALAAFSRSASLDPLNADPGRFAGTLALQDGRYREAIARFRQSISRDRLGWFSWFGLGLAQSALGHRTAAHRDLAFAYSIENRQFAVQKALELVDSAHPLSVSAAFSLLVLQR